MDQQALHNIDAERALLGSVIIDPAAREELQWLAPDRFYLIHHQWIWEAFESLESTGQPVDYLTLSAELDRAGRLSEVGGAAYLTRLITEVPTSVHAEAYARLVDREWRRRRLIDSATELAKAAYGDDPTAPARVLADVEKILSDASPDRLQAAADLSAEVTEQVIHREALAARTVPTGLRDWDRTLGGGLERGTLAVLMARPSMGKTAALCQVADWVSEHVGPVAFFSQEMNARQILMRMACRRARVSSLALRQGKTSAEQERRVLDALAALGQRSGLWVNDAPQTTADMHAACNRLERRTGLALVVTDHLRLFRDQADNENHRLGDISQGHKFLAKSLDVAVIAAAQLSRGIESSRDRRPDLKDLRDSGEIEENADVVTALYRDSYYSEKSTDRTAEFINRKNRDGERNARATLVFQPEYLGFEPLAIGVT